MNLRTILRLRFYKMSKEIMSVNNDTTNSIINITSKINKKKAMSSEKASKVKKDGHSNEDEFALLLPGSFVVSGTGKTDVQYKEFSFSLKKICKRIQLALYSIKSKNWLESSPSAMLCKDCLTIYPKTFEEYTNNKNMYKELLREKMVNLKNHLSIRENLSEYLNLIIFKNGEVDFLVMKDKDSQYIYYSTEVLNVLLDNIEIFNSVAMKKGDFPEQKVIIKSKNNNNKLANLIEIEIRNSSEGHYAQMLCVCNRDNLFNLLNNNIEKTKMTNNTTSETNIVLKGESINLLSEI